MRRTFRIPLILPLAAAGLALVPFTLAAQEPVRTHTVKKGDTLWDLAQQYLGDPFRWPEIYRRNTETVKDPHWIYPDQVLIISGDVAPTPGTPADQPAAAPADTMAGRQAPAAPAAGEQQPVYVQKPMTIFNPARFRVVRGTRESLTLRSRASAVRAGDYLRSPFLAPSGGVSGAGTLDATTSSDGVGLTLTKRPVQLYERVYVQLPSGARGEKDERFILFRDGPALQGEGQVIIPTGVVKLNRPAENGRAEATLLTKFEDVYAGQRVMAIDTLTPRPGVFPTRVEFGSRTTLIWIYDEPVLPGIGHHVIFAAGSGEGLVPGDQVTLQLDMGVDARGVPLPPEDIAVAQVTRVTPQGASAVILAESDGGIKAGMAARVTAKMP